MVYCNTTLEDASITEEPLFGEVTFHHIGLVISAVFSIISLIIAFFLMQKHATHYSKPWEQKHIIRIILMLPVYSTVSFLSYLFYQHSVYFETGRDCYEAFAIASFFTLLCNYIAPNLHDQKDYFRKLEPINWFWSVFGLQKCTGGQDKGFLRRPKSGLTWFNVIWFGIFQYCFIRVFFTIVSVVAQSFGKYCEDSLNPAFAHVWVMVIESADVTVAMFLLIQFYLQLKEDLAEHRPFLKVLCIKLVIFFSFWQSLLISFLTSTGVIGSSKTIADQDIQIGIPSMLLCIEMAIFAVMHLFAFPWREYDICSPSYKNPLLAPGSGFSGSKVEYKGGKWGMKAWLDAFNPWDIIKATARGTRWLFVGRKRRHHDISYRNSQGVVVTDIPGPNVTSAPSPPSPVGTELQGRGRSDTVEQYDDRAGLLSHAHPHAAAGHSPSPSPIRQESYTEGDDGVDISLASGQRLHMPPPLPQQTVAFPEAGHYGGVPSPLEMPMPGMGGGVGVGMEDTGYHAAPAALSNSQLRQHSQMQAGISPSQSHGQGQNMEYGQDQWDHWGGAGKR